MTFSMKTYNIFKILKLILCDVYIRKKDFYSKYKLYVWTPNLLINKEIKFGRDGHLLVTSRDDLYFSQGTDYMDKF